MDLSQYVERLRSDLTDSAAAGDDEVRAAAERLALALNPSTRMVLFEVLSDATAEITNELQSATVEVRLKGREPEFVVSEPSENIAPPPPPPPPAPPAPPTSEEGQDGDVVARVTVRIPEWLKTRAEDLASDQSQSLNTWIVNAVKSATNERAVTVDLDLGSYRAKGGPQSKHFQGWAR